MEQVLLIVQVLIAVSLIGIILIQRSDTDGFGLGSGSGSNLLSGRATANLLTRTTAILATLFILNSLALSIFAARERHHSIVEQIEQQENRSRPAPLRSTRPHLPPPRSTCARTRLLPRRRPSPKRPAPHRPRRRPGKTTRPPYRRRNKGVILEKIPGGIFIGDPDHTAARRRPSSKMPPGIFDVDSPIILPAGKIGE
ncbi:MAG: preprotein translocase subunit SecG [Alphaproteobacteria bacterium]